MLGRRGGIHRGEAKSQVYYGYLTEPGKSGGVAPELTEFVPGKAADILGVSVGRMKILPSPYDPNYRVFCTVVDVAKGFRKQRGMNYIPTTDKDRERESNWRATAVCGKAVTGEAIIASVNKITESEFNKFTGECYGRFTKDSGAMGEMKKKGFTIPGMNDGSHQTKSQMARNERKKARAEKFSQAAGAVAGTLESSTPRGGLIAPHSPPITSPPAPISKAKKKKLAKKRREAKIRIAEAVTPSKGPSYSIPDIDLGKLFE